MKKPLTALLVVALLMVFGAGMVIGSVHGTFEGYPIVQVEVNGEAVEGDVPAINLKGRTMVPLRFVSEALGADVSWDEDRYTAIVSTKKTALEDDIKAVLDVDGYRVATDPDPYEQFYISQAIRVGNLVFVSGQAAIDEEGNLVGVGDFDAQAEQTFENLKKVLEAAGSSMDQIVKVTIILKDMEDFPKILDLRQKYFSKPYPADTILEAELGLPELEIEIEAIAIVEGKLHDLE